MCFHGNQLSWGIKHPFISLNSKYQSLKYVCLLIMNAPVFPSLDDIYCRCGGIILLSNDCFYRIHVIRKKCWRSTDEQNKRHALF